MTKQISEDRPAHTDSPHFDALQPYMDKVAVGAMRRDRLFSLCVKASLCKCYEFNREVRRTPNSDGAFFAMSSLRGICEDLIVLNYLKGIPKPDREELVSQLMAHEVHTRIKLQDAFFTASRPQQPVLRIQNVEQKIDTIASAARAVWNRHGWPGLKQGPMPQIRQIAEKQGLQELAILYDYLYRLTSSGVHFNVHSLLRSGWGPNRSRFRFSTGNFNRYFTAYCSTYGAFMFCVYFEFFGSFLRPGPKVAAVISKIRKSLLLSPRWPEMVTFEEMNMPVPNDSSILRLLVSIKQAEEMRRLIQ